MSGSRMILGVAMIMPNALKVSYSSCARRNGIRTYRGGMTARTMVHSVHQASGG